MADPPRDGTRGPGGSELRFLDYEFPEFFEVFYYEQSTKSWGYERRCRAADLARLEDGTYLHQVWGSPLYLRIKTNRGGVLTILDGGGDPWRCIILPTDVDPRLEDRAVPDPYE
jgi:hypothetical protein